MPPPTEITRPLQSTVPKSGWLAIALKSVLTAGKLWNFSPCSCLNTAGRSRGLAIRMLAPPIRMPSMMFVLKPKM